MNIPGYKSAVLFLGTVALALGFAGVARAETAAGAEQAAQATVVSTENIWFSKTDTGVEKSGLTPISLPVTAIESLSAESGYSTQAIELLPAIAQTSGTGDTRGSDGTSAQTTPGSITPGTTTPDAAPGTTTPDVTPGTTVPDATPGTTTPVAPESTPPTTPETTPAPGTTTPVEPAPSLVITPGRPTRSGPSYIGVGGNIGLGEGDTALGEGSFAVFSKIGLTRNISIRPAVLFSDNASILIPVTFDFIPLVTRATETATEAVGFRASPYIGPGIIISTGDDGSVDFLLTGGVDVPLTDRLSVTAQVNASFFDNVAVGLLLGVGFNF